MIRTSTFISRGSLIAFIGIEMGSCALPQSSWEHWTAPASIRSLDVLNDEEARYAGSDGWIGQFSGETNTWEHRQLTAPDGRTPSFRSSSYAGEKWFAASIESPAWILQTSSNGWAPNWVHHDTSAAVFLDAMAWWDDKEGMVFGDPIDGCIHLRRLGMPERPGPRCHATTCRRRWKEKLDLLHPMETCASKETRHGSLQAAFPPAFFEPWTAG